VVIQSITGVEGAPEGAGVRISQENPADPAVAVTTTESPLPGDQVVEESGARVFSEKNASAALDDEILDAAVDDKGGVEFLRVPQPRTGRENGSARTDAMDPRRRAPAILRFGSMSVPAVQQSLWLAEGAGAAGRAGGQEPADSSTGSPQPAREVRRRRTEKAWSGGDAQAPALVAVNYA
jgi:iron-sulfur cluster assembly protein